MQLPARSRFCSPALIFMANVKGYATRERFLQRIRQNPPNLRKILSHDGVFNEIVIARHAQLNRFSR